VQHDTPGLFVVTGVSLAALMDFVFCDADMPAAESTARAVEKGRAAIVSLAI
jgi:mannose/fructose-specific phosphotransferase system component IIA